MMGGSGGDTLGWEGNPVVFTVAERREHQFERLREESCPAGLWDGDHGSVPNHLKHSLFKTKTRRLKDFFMRRDWWRCWGCDLKEEIVS